MGNDDVNWHKFCRQTLGQLNHSSLGSLTYGWPWLIRWPSILEILIWSADPAGTSFQ
jgi:hypothetical protein